VTRSALFLMTLLLTVSLLVDLDEDRSDKNLRSSLRSLEQVLESETSCRFRKIPLRQVLHELAWKHQIRFFLDEQAVTDEGISLDQEVTLEISGISLETALHLLLHPLGLDLVNDGNSLTVTTAAKADEDSIYQAVYPVGDLVDATNPDADLDNLITMFLQSTGGRWMENDGDGGEITQVNQTRSLVVRQDQRAHRQIEGILSALRRARELQRLSPTVEAPGSISVPERAPSTVSPRSSRFQAWQRPRIHAP